jgi:hypothetical protein
VSLQILEDLRQVGIHVTPRGNDLLVCPASKLTPELRERLRAAKAQVLAALRSRSARIVVPCWHCRSGRCSCIVCADGLPVGAKGPCAVCRGTGKVIGWLT